MVIVTCTYNPNIEGHSQVNLQSKLASQPTATGKLLVQQENLFQDSKVQSDRGRHQTSSSGLFRCALRHVYLHIYIQPTIHKHTLLHLGHLSSWSMSTVRSLGDSRFMACLPCSLLLFSGLNVTGLNEDPSEKPDLPCVGASEGKKKEKDRGCLRTPSCMVLQHKLSQLPILNL